MRRYIVLVAIAVLTAPAALLADSISTGTRTVPETGGVFGSGCWDGAGLCNKKTDNGFQVSWDIRLSADPRYYDYSYTISGTGGAPLSKELSHWILEVSDSFTELDIADVRVNGHAVGWELDMYTKTSNGASNPNLEAPIWGIKFDGGNDGVQTFTFNSTRVPVWGDFYAKSGAKDVLSYAYNVGIGTGPATDASDFTAWIMTPDSVDRIQNPEPGSLILLGTGLLGIGFYARKKISKKNSR
jgi:hypothetical protein